MIDINLNPGSPLVNNEVDIIIQQVDMLFDTAKKEVLGIPDYGTDYDEFLFNLQMSNAAIAYQVECDIRSLELFGFEPTVEVSILEGTLNDIVLITIGLRRNETYYEKTYKLQ